MKRNLITLFFLLTVVLTFSQSVPRNYVVLEIGTGTWCTYCPGAANGAHDLLANGCQVAVIENHNGDAFANTNSDARNTYYGITGYPTANFDGTTPMVGGAACPNGNVYGSYLPLYNAAIAVTSPLKIDISGTNAGNVYSITLSIHKVNTITATDLRVHLALTESNIATAPWPGSGGCMTKVDHVQRLFVPDHNGTPLSFATGDFQIVNLTFTRDASWVAGECELVAFVQSNGAKTIYNAMKVALNALPAPMSVDFTGTPLSGCSPVNVNFSGSATGATNWQWSCPGGSPASSTVQNPAVSYTTPGSWDVTLTAWDAATGRGNAKTKSAYVTVNSVPGAPGMPQGTAGMCSNPPNQAYTATAATGATSYTWELTPAAAGTLTPSGTSCTVDFADSWTGTAELRVKGSNSCGDGLWSPALSITVSEQPSTPGTPSGTDQLCLNAPNTDYSVTGGTPSTSFIWELLPYDAGAIYPNGNTCTVDWVNTWSGSATLRTKAMNGSCESEWSGYLNITVNPGPAAYNVTGGGPYCGQGGTGSEVGLDDSESGVNYTLYLNGTATTTVIAGTGNAISFGDQLSAGEYTVVGANAAAGCDNDMLGSATVTIDPEPPYTPGAPEGPGHVYTGSTPTSDYITSGGQYATSYSWELTPASAGVVSGTGTTGTVTWDQAYSGEAEIKVQGVNSCGGGSFSIILEVTVDVGVGIIQSEGGEKFRLYPNPAKQLVYLTGGLSGKADVTIYNAFGGPVMNLAQVGLPGPVTIDLSAISPGIYLVRIQGTNQTVNLKLIVR